MEVRRDENRKGSTEKIKEDRKEGGRRRRR